MNGRTRIKNIYVIDDDVVVEALGSVGAALGWLHWVAAASGVAEGSAAWPKAAPADRVLDDICLPSAAWNVWDG